MTAIDMTTWTREELIDAGEKLFGHEWQSALARYLHITDRTVRRWVALPPGTDLLEMDKGSGGSSTVGPSCRAVRNALLLLDHGVRPDPPPRRGRPPKEKPVEPPKRPARVKSASRREPEARPALR